MKIKEYIEFVKEEIPTYAEEVSTALDLLISSIENSKVALDSRVPHLLSNNEYEKTNKLVEVSKGVSELCNQLKEYLERLAELSKEEQEVFEDEIVEPDAMGKIDYEKYRIDDSIAYNLYSDFTHKKPAAFVFEGKKYLVDKWKALFLETCGLLWKKSPAIFVTFLDDEDLNGRTRMYFSQQKEKLREPRLVPNSDIYVETNMSANQIRNTVIKMLEKYNTSRGTYQIYLCKDYTDLHK